jgi:hypothetical protein
MDELQTPLAPYELRWPRFSEYVVEGDYIRPAPGAEPEWYSVWDTYAPPARERQLEGAHLDLFCALDAIGTRAERDAMIETGRLSRQAKDRLAQWCSQYGLLGLLLQKLVAARFSAEAGVSYEFRLRGTTWDLCPVLEKDAFLPDACVVIDDGDGLKVRDLESGQEPYVPSLAPCQGPLQFYTESWWAHYREPWREFLGKANELDCITQVLAPPDPDGTKKLAEKTMVQLLNRMAPKLMTSMRKSRHGHYEQVYCTPTLLAALAKMSQTDTIAGRHVLRCSRPACARPYRAGEKASDYCTETCRNASAKQRQRASKKGRIAAR